MFKFLIQTTKARLSQEAALRTFHRSPVCTEAYVNVYHALESEGFLTIESLESSRHQTDRFDISFIVIGA